MADRFDVNRFFDEFGDTRKQASVDAVFGTPVESNGKTVIPIAAALYAFGMGGGSSEHDETANVGSGGGSGYAIQPVALAVIDEAGVRIDPVIRMERVMIAGILMGAWTVLWLGRVLLRLASRSE
jgi:uncharacterized spore protein YtfJ